MGTRELIEISRFYGSDPDFLIAGGGNTSFKDNGILHVKASGYQLASITGDGFARLDMKKLNRIWMKNYPADTDLREAEALKDLMDSRIEGEEKRPSVESLLHAILPQKYIVHTHPAMVNGLTCSKNSQRETEKLFGTRCMWVPSVNPGYVMAKLIRDIMEKHKKKYRSDPDIIMLQNHGMFAGADTVKEIRVIHDYVINTLKGHIMHNPDFSSIPVDKKAVEKVNDRLKKYHAFKNYHITFENNTEISSIITDKSSFKKVQFPYTPDQIVYAGPEILFTNDIGYLEKDIEYYKKRNSCSPGVMAVKNTGVFSIGISQDSSRVAMLLFLDALKISVYAGSFGGYRFMDKKQIEFIKNWEVEKYRARLPL